MGVFKYGWLFIMTAMIGDIAVSSLLSFFFRGYSNVRMSISALGAPGSPVRLPFNIWMILEGVLFLASIPAIYTCYAPVSGGITKTMVTFIAVFAVGACIFTGFFSVNTSKDVVTTASKIHGAGSVIGFTLFLFVPLMLGILSFKNSETGIGAVSIICFVLALIFFALFVMSDKPEFKETIARYEGLWQRLNLIFMYLPLMIAAIKAIASP
ncbi:MAG: DUF998 domain-containing protein [Lachnospiraceae bacterium]|nr:DUF998 domain-containing protein [Lachnospiraceae bacterium]